MVEQNSYAIKPITINGNKIACIVIATHYKEKHADHMTDELILRLVNKLDGRKELPEAKTDRYAYFVTMIALDEKQYRLIWLLENHAVYVGIINAYRDKRRE